MKYFFIALVSSTVFLFSALTTAHAQQEETEVPIQTDDRGVIIVSGRTLAEENVRLEAEATQLINIDQNVTHTDLGVGDPKILPGNPFYAFKGFARNIRSAITFDPTKKAELGLQFANERIIEARKLDERGADPEAIKKAIESYQTEVGNVKSQVEKLKGGADTARIEEVVGKIADNQIKHYKLLDGFMKGHEDIAPEIEAQKTEAMKRMSESMAGVVDPTVLRQKFTEAMAKQKGSSFRQLKNIEILEQVKDSVPEQARDAIQNAIEQSSKLFKEEFDQATDEHRQIFDKYIEKLGGNEVRHLESLDDINSFNDIQKDMNAEMEQAREKARKRIGERIANIKDETRKKVFLAHLEDGNIEDARIVKELENNLPAETVTSILDIKHRMQEKMREKFENAQSQGDLDPFFKEIQNSPDVRMMEVLKEMEGVIPEDKKEFWQEMKKKAMTEMQKGFDQARQFGRLEEQSRQVAGFDPEQVKVIEEFQGEFGPEFNFFNDIKKEQADHVKERFQQFNQFAKEHPEAKDFIQNGEDFRLRIQEDPSTQSSIEQFAPGIRGDFQRFDRQKEEIQPEPANLDETIKKTESLIADLTKKISEAGSADADSLNASRQLLDNSKRALLDSQQALASGEEGKASGRATSAFTLARNGLKKLNISSFQSDQHDYFEKRDDFREKFKDLPQGERPDPRQFLEFKQRFSPGFVPPAQFQGRPEGDHEGQLCAQVLTPAHHPNGKCVTFPNSCIPPGWERVGSCEGQDQRANPTTERRNEKESQERNFPPKETEERMSPEKQQQFFHEGQKLFEQQQFDQQKFLEQQQKPEVTPQLFQTITPRPTQLATPPFTTPFPTEKPIITPFITPFPTIIEFQKPIITPFPTANMTPFPTITPFPTKETTPIPAVTQFPTATPFPTMTPFPTASVTPFPTITPFPTANVTPFPTMPTKMP